MNSPARGRRGRRPAVPGGRLRSLVVGLWIGVGATPIGVEPAFGAEPPSTSAESGVPLAPGASDSAARRLTDLQRRIEARRARIATYERRESGLLETLDEVDRAADDLSVALRETRNALRVARVRLAEAEAQAAAAGERRDEVARALATRVVALQREGDTGILRALFTPGSLRDRASRVRMLGLLATRDRRLVERHRAADRALGEATAAVDAARAARHDARETARTQRLALADERTARERLLAGVRSDRAREAALLSELERAAQALDDRLGALGESPAPSRADDAATPFASLRGQLLPPVDAPIARRFGRAVDARFGTTSLSRGVDYAARRGQSVRAISEGTVRFADWFRGYGKTVILDHGEDYFTVAGHLDEIAVATGDRVAAGQEIGRAGDTGSLSGTRLYFELRRGKEALDPAAWLHR